MRVDLDEIAGELAEHEFVVGGQTFTAPGDLGVEQLLRLRALAGQAKIDFDKNPEASLDAIRSFFVLVFGDEQGAELLRVCGMRRLPAIITAIAEIYELSDAEGKAQGSSRASRRAGARSKPTSNGSTKSTSARRASVAKKNGSAARGSRG